MQEIVTLAPPASECRTEAPERGSVVVGLVQHRWNPDPAALRAELAEGIARAAGHGARAVFLPELTLSRYPADTLPAGRAADAAEDLLGGPTFAFAAEQASRHGVHVHASLYQQATAEDGSDDGLGLNTAIIAAPDGTLAAATHKLHIPRTAGYHEDRYFRPGPAADPYPVHAPAGLDTDAGSPLRLGLPTCWDEWFPEPARAYALAGADALAYPTAIGSEPDHPGFDTEPLWRQSIIGHGIANGLFMIVPNRWGAEGSLTFYGSSFIADPFGRVLARAPRDASAVLVASLDLDQRRDWLTLFPFLRTRRPDTYGVLAEPVADTPLGIRDDAGAPSRRDARRGGADDAGASLRADRTATAGLGA
ncbi:nitrilase-related carbon-nitrogen hydrolase [Zafaria sp. Z1313]|uniref:nitrilase-related carbon-nitrogen hydrolase n=1 Tax=Zafaria sp. Z1313 TaxID=3423202 RepID=UPI003D302FC5